MFISTQIIDATINSRPLKAGKNLLMVAKIKKTIEEGYQTRENSVPFCFYLHYFSCAAQDSGNGNSTFGTTAK